MSQIDSRQSHYPSSHDAETTPAMPRSSYAPSTASAAAGPPERIAGYRILKVLGAGGMGQVYLAKREDSSYAQQVALKVIKRGMDTDDIVRRFELERKVLAGMNHPNIARLIDGGTTEEGLPYFALEYVDGQPIDKYCDTHRLNTKSRLALFRKVCSAVQYAHQNLIVHRDLKPGNILVSSDGTPKLLDFGIAKLLNPNLFEVTQVTGPGVRLMTPEYASPEQVRGDPITTASDIYSLGVILYELLTGRRPYKFKTRLQAEIVRIVCEEEPDKPSTAISRAVRESSVEAPPATEQTEAAAPSAAVTRGGDLTRLRRTLQGDIDDIVLKAIDKSPQRRYATPEQLAEDIQRHIEGEPVIARPPSMTYKLGKFLKRNRGPVAAAAAVFLAVSAGAAATTIQWRSAEAARAAAVAQREEADQQRNIADQNAREALAQKQRADQAYAELWGLNERFLDGFHAAVIKLPGSLPARELLVNTSLEYMTKMQALDPDDKDKLFGLAGVYERLGQMSADLRSGNKNDIDQAIVHQRKALELREPALAADPERPNYVLGVATSHIRLGDLQLQTGKLSEAEASYTAALPLLRKQDKDAKEAVPFLQRIAAAQAKLGEIKQRTGDLAGAEAYLEESQLVRRRALALDPSANNKRNVAVGHSAFAKLLMEREEFAKAVEQFDASIAIRRDLLSAAPEAARERRDLAVALFECSNALVDAGELDKALAYATESRDMLLKLRADDQSVEGRDARNLSSLAFAHLMVSDALLKKGDAAGSLPDAEAALAIADPLLAEDSQSASNKRLVVQALSALGESLTEAGRPAEALLRLDRARSLSAELVALDSDNITQKRRYARIYRRSADASLALAMTESESRPARQRAAAQAAEWYQQALLAAEEVAKAGLAPLSGTMPEELRAAVDKARAQRDQLARPAP